MHVALREHGRAFGVETGREQHRRQVERLLAEVVRVVVDADRVQVDDAEEAFAALLRGGVLAEAADQVAEVLSPVGWMPEKMRMSVLFIVWFDDWQRTIGTWPGYRATTLARWP